MNRRSLMQKLFVGLAFLLPVKLFARKEAQWKHLAIPTRDVEEQMSFDGAMIRILEDLTVCANRAIEEARYGSEPLARMEFSWRRILVDGRDSCFARFLAIKGDVSLGSLDKTPNGEIKFTRFPHANG